MSCFGPLCTQTPAINTLMPTHSSLLVGEGRMYKLVFLIEERELRF